MVEKVVLLICDGLGDRPIDELGALTPLEAAETPCLDRLARESECGLMYPLGRGLVPGSDVAHLAILGYDPQEYYAGRGTIEAAGLGILLRPGDVALRGNFATVDGGGIVRDRRAGRIRVVEPLVKPLDGIELDGVTFMVKAGTAHRAVVVMRGEGLSASVTDADPHKAAARLGRVSPRDNTPEARRTADVLNRFIDRASAILHDHPLNIERRRDGHAEANYLLLRGAGHYREVPSFRERYGLSACCIAGGGMYKGIGRYLGMTVLEVPGATGLPDSDVPAKFRAALRSLETFDFVFVHVKATDSFGEDGDFIGKRTFIETIDRAARVFESLPANTLFVMTGDHSTPCALREHSADPVPIMLRGSGVRVDDVVAFGERACARGGLGTLSGTNVMHHVLNILGRLPLAGA